MTAGMATGWPNTVFRDIVEDSAFGPRFSAEYYDDDGNIATLRTTDISEDGRISYDTMPHARLDESKFQNHFLQPGDLVISRSGRIGTTAVFSGFPDPVLPGAFLIRFRLKSCGDPRFYRYFFNAPTGRALLLSVARGVAQQNINITNVAALRVPVPPLSEQQRIADVLSAYDDLIENNRRRIQLLEQAARLLYKEWFVHLRFPGHEHVKVNDGVPEGWEKKPVDDLTSFLSRGITPKYDDEAEGVVINQKCIRDRIVSLSLARRQRKQPPPAKLVQWGDVLVNSTGAGTLGRVAQFHDIAENLTVDSHVTIVRPGDGVPPHLFGLHLTNLESYIATMGRGVTNQTELSRQTIAEIRLLMPPRDLSSVFEDVVAPIFMQIGILSKQIDTLASARDLLLPRLMNGEIAVETEVQSREEVAL